MNQLIYPSVKLACIFRSVFLSKTQAQRKRAVDRLTGAVGEALITCMLEHPSLGGCS